MNSRSQNVRETRGRIFTPRANRATSIKSISDGRSKFELFFRGGISSNQITRLFFLFYNISSCSQVARESIREKKKKGEKRIRVEKSGRRYFGLEKDLVFKHFPSPSRRIVNRRAIAAARMFAARSLGPPLVLRMPSLVSFAH